jgi:D-alanine transaminase
LNSGRIIYLDGAFVGAEDAKVSVFDRGFLFGDGVYEVSAVVDGSLLDNAPHLARLERSLAAIDIPNPMTAEAWLCAQRELIVRNGLSEGLLYLQVTRGAGERDFAPPRGLRPTVAMFTQAKAVRDTIAGRDGIRVVTVPDLRWKRRDIKTTALLAQVLAKREAQAAGADEAWMVEDGMVTEGASSTAFIVTSGPMIVTRPLSRAILPGVTRLAVLALQTSASALIDERAFTIEEALAADEAFVTSASSLVTPVVSINGRPVGDGKPGPLTRRMREFYLAFAERRSEAAE